MMSISMQNEVCAYFVLLEPFLQDLGLSAGRSYLFLASKPVKNERFQNFYTMGDNM